MGKGITIGKATFYFPGKSFGLKFNPNNSDLGFIRIEKLVWIHSDSKSQINMSQIDFLPICIKQDWKLFSDWLGWVRNGSDTRFRKSNCFRINFNLKLLSGLLTAKRSLIDGQSVNWNTAKLRRIKQNT